MATNDWLEEQARIREARMNAESVYRDRALQLPENIFNSFTDWAGGLLSNSQVPLVQPDAEQVGRAASEGASFLGRTVADIAQGIAQGYEDFQRGYNERRYYDEDDIPAGFTRETWWNLGPQGRLDYLTRASAAGELVGRNVGILGNRGFRSGDFSQEEQTNDIELIRDQYRTPEQIAESRRQRSLERNLTRPELLFRPETLFSGGALPMTANQRAASISGVDEEGNPIYSQSMMPSEIDMIQRGSDISQRMSAAEGATVTREPVLDADGNPVRGPRQPVLDENGKPVIGPDGEPVTREGDIVTRSVVTGGGTGSGLLSPTIAQDLYSTPEGQKILGNAQPFTGEKEDTDKGFLSGFGKRAQGILKKIGVAQEQNPEAFDRLTMALSGMSTSPNIGLQQSILQDQADRAELNRAVLTQLQSETPFTRQAAADFAEWAAGGEAELRGDMNVLSQLTTALANTQNASGPLVGNLPDTIRQMIPSLAEGQNIQQGIESIAQKNLRRILGGQFTQREGEMLLARVFNPRAQEQYNVERARRLLETLQEQYMQKQAAYDYYLQNGTIEGFRTGVTNLADLENQFADELWSIADEYSNKPSNIDDAVWRTMRPDQRALFTTS
jgi:hypothetical protein